MWTIKETSLLSSLVSLHTDMSAQSIALKFMDSTMNPCISLLSVLKKVYALQKEISLQRPNTRLDRRQTRTTGELLMTRQPTCVHPAIF